MLYDVLLWLCIAPFGAADLACRVDALSVEDAAFLALRVYELVSAAYVSVSMVNPVPGTIIARAWGPVVREVC